MITHKPDISPTAQAARYSKKTMVYRFDSVRLWPRSKHHAGPGAKMSEAEEDGDDDGDDENDNENENENRKDKQDN